LEWHDPKTGEVSSGYRENGYFPEAVVNFLALLGWNPGTEQEIFTREELEQLFDLDKVQKAGAVFGEDKLAWFNREYIKKLSTKEFWDYAKPWIPSSFNDDQILKKIESIIRDRIEKFADVKTLFEEGEMDYFFKAPKIDNAMLVWKDSTLEKAHEYLKEVKSILKDLESWDYESIKGAIWPYADKEGRGAVLWPMRVALSGREKSPDPFEIASILGKEETLKRLGL
jgi:glutamyl/glutaminyl-tRNA synthetase